MKIIIFFLVMSTTLLGDFIISCVEKKTGNHMALEVKSGLRVISFLSPDKDSLKFDLTNSVEADTLIYQERGGEDMKIAMEIGDHKLFLAIGHITDKKFNAEMLLTCKQKTSR